MRELEEVLFQDVGDRIKSSGKWPLLIDESGQAATFLKYRDTNYICAINPSQMQPEVLRIALLGSIRSELIFLFFNKKHRRKSAEQKSGLSFAVRQAQV